LLPIQSWLLIVSNDSFSLYQCQQVFTHMDMELKKILRSKIDSVAPLYGLTDICFPSFSRSYGWRGQTSASDAVYCLSALLETSPEVAHRLGETVEWNNGEQLSADAIEDENEPANGEPETPRPKKTKQRWWLQNFYTAYDALDR
jgi:cell division control protein 45